MKHNQKKKRIFTTVKYLFKFTFFLLKDRYKKLQKQFNEYQKSDIEIKDNRPKPYRSKSITIIKPKEKKKPIFPLLVLFDAENMPIQDHYSLTQKIIVEKFGRKSWDNAKLETAYKESTESYNNKGYNQAIKTYYVTYGKDKADDKLVELAKKHKIPHVIIVSNDKELIARLQDVTSKYTSGKLFVYNGAFLKEYTLNSTQIELSRLKTLKAKRANLLKECDLIDKEIAQIERRSQIEILPKIKKSSIQFSVSKNLQEANIDKHIKSDLIQNPLFIGFTEQLAQVNAPTKKEAQVQSQKVLKLFTQLPRINTLLETKGLNISIFKISLRYAINNFDQSNYGYISFVKFIEYILKDNQEIKLVLKGTSEYKLLLKDTPINELEMSEIAEQNNYGIKDNLLSEKFGTSFADLDFFKKKVS